MANTTTRKPGRPPKTSTDRVRMLRVSSEAHAVLVAYAEERGLSLYDAANEMISGHDKGGVVD